MKEKILLETSSGWCIARDPYCWILARRSNRGKTSWRYPSYHGSLEQALVHLLRRLDSDEATTVAGYLAECRKVVAEMRIIAREMSNLRPRSPCASDFLDDPSTEALETTGGRLRA